MANKFTYYDGNTHTPCSKQDGRAFLIAQNGGEVRKDGVRVMWVNQGYLFENPGRVSGRKGTDAFRITAKMREVAQQEMARIAGLQRKYYLIDFVYTENGQQFGTGADLNEHEVAMLEKYLRELEANGWLTDPHVHEPGPVIHQSYTKVRKEIAEALRS